VDGCGYLAQHRGWADPVAGHEQPEAQPLVLWGERREQCPALEGRAVRVNEYRHEGVEQPPMLDPGDRVRLAPDPQEVVVGDLHGGGHDSEAEPAGRCEGVGHFESILPSGSLVATTASRAAGHAPSSRPSAVSRYARVICWISATRSGLSSVVRVSLEPWMPPSPCSAPNKVRRSVAPGLRR